jgi:hypothetical protein
MKRALSAALAILLLGPVAALPSAAWAQPSGAVALSGSMGPLLRGMPNVAIPAYHVTFITQKQGTAVGSITARTRLNTVLAGVDEALMRRLADEAHADLVAQLTAAGVPVLPDAAARALASGVAAVPGNGDVAEVGAGVTIGRSLRNGYAAYGAQAAPLLAPFHDPKALEGAAPMAAMAIMGAANGMGRAARAAGAAAIVPAITIDFVDMDARSTSRTANVDAAVSFALRAPSGATVIGQGASGPGYFQAVRMSRDVRWADGFARVDEGAAGVRQGSMTATPDRNFVMRDRARGDLIEADPEVWAGLVRQAYRAFNAALTAEIVKARR